MDRKFSPDGSLINNKKVLRQREPAVRLATVQRVGFCGVFQRGRGAFIYNTYQKLHVKNRAGAITKAREVGIFLQV